MQLVVITTETEAQNEMNSIKDLLNAGIVVHLRKKLWTNQQVKDFAAHIEAEERKLLTLHSNVDNIIDTMELGISLGFGGFHLAAKEHKYDALTAYSRFSSSCHSLKEVKKVSQALSYVFLSPIYDSISKEGYKANINLNKLGVELRNSPETKVFALGGVSDDKLNELQSLNFSGAAICGAFWNLNENDRLIKIKQWKTINQNMC